MKKEMWILYDNRKGSASQAKGIAYALADKIKITEKHLVYNKLSILPNLIQGKSLIGIDLKKSSEIKPPFPDIVLSTSRRCVATARFIKKQSGNKSKIVQLMYPGKCGTKEMDMIIVPKHDKETNKKGKNVFLIDGAPNKIFPEILEQEKIIWQEKFADLPKPWIAVLVGGAIKGKAWGSENAKDLAEEIVKIHKKLGGSILITTSRRTGDEEQKILMEKLNKIKMYTYLWGEKKENPIMGFYACADMIIATADSVSMCCEACSSGKPVLLFKGQNWLTQKHIRFAKSLIAQNYAEDIKEYKDLDLRKHKSLNSAKIIADKILEICQS